MAGSLAGGDRDLHVVEGVRAEAERRHRLAEPDTDLVVEDAVVGDHRPDRGAAGEDEDTGGLQVLDGAVERVAVEVVRADLVPDDLVSVEVFVLAEASVYACMVTPDSPLPAMKLPATRLL
jgi:hypothetical protein